MQMDVIYFMDWATINYGLRSSSRGASWSTSSRSVCMCVCVGFGSWAGLTDCVVCDEKGLLTETYLLFLLFRHKCAAFLKAWLPLLDEWAAI